VETLEAQGLASRAVVARIAALAAERPDLAAVVHRPGTLLDIGAGVAHLAIEAARTYLALRVIGLDVWVPALALALANIAASGVSERIELRAQGIEDLAERDTFSLVWLPTPFIAREIVEAALGRVHRALEPGGWLVVGLFAIPDEPLSQALARLQIVRSGGYRAKSAS
jgi:cyclopropane fatty-acyl-phospholipid synthase-like methyltransferase